MRASHIGMAVDPRVIKVVGDALLRQSSTAVATLSVAGTA
jgi:hypothetical protein